MSVPPRAFALALTLAACASAPASRLRTERVPAEPRADAGVEDSGLAAREVAWLVAHLADDPDPASPRETEAVRRLSARGAEGLRAAVEVFRVGDARRLPFARRVFERHLRRVCGRDEERITRALRVFQGLDASPDGGLGARWIERSGGWSHAAMRVALAWIDGGAGCEAR
ncbi:MAG: hypothetical protein R3A48_06455 [Polyangiales bacterium]